MRHTELPNQLLRLQQAFNPHPQTFQMRLYSLRTFFWKLVRVNALILGHHAANHGHPRFIFDWRKGRGRGASMRLWTSLPAALTIRRLLD